MSIYEVLYSSRSEEWGTPQDLFDKLDAEFHFDVDVCATGKNAKCSKFFTKEHDGLKQSWLGKTVWCNPPYGKKIAEWVKKAYLESRAGGGVHCSPSSRKNRHAIFSRLYIPQGRCSFHSRKASLY